MRLLKVTLIILVLCGISALLPGCASKPATTVTGRVVTVRRGNLSTDITGVGNLALSHTEDLAFDIPSSFNIVSKPITVEEVLVKAGDSVQEGQLLAKLDISGWDDQIATLKDAVTTANRTVTTKERAVTAAERNIPAKKLDVLNKQSLVNQAQLDLENTEEMSTDILEIQIAEAKLEVAKGNLEAAQIAIEDAQIAVEDAKTVVEDTRTAVENAKKNLADAQSASPEIKAPFTGFITNVNVSGGGEMKKGTIAMTIADPNKFEANILVNEMNMSQVKLGGAATVTLDSIPGVILAANLTQISPTATIQSSVVNYQVKVEIQSLQPVTQARQSSANTTSANITSSQLPNRSRQGSSSGNFTQEQIQAMINQRQQSATGQSQQQTSTTVPTSFQLRQGLTVTVRIIVQERNNALLVPNQAITLQREQAYVQVQKADGTTEQRTIQTGINNSQYTEVISGLNEGENVIVPQATTTTSTTSQQGQGQQGGMGIPGMGRLLR